jgi:prepilin-type N-terminal cleavage/methylation domain-containing protein
MPMHVNVKRVLRDEGGFGLIELLIAMTVLVIGIMATFAMFESGIRHIKRASTVTTAAALADAEMENFRAIRYTAIGLDDDHVDAAVASSPPYADDPAYPVSAANRVVVPACGSPPCTNDVPVRTVTGADGESYRVDTYITWQEVTAGEDVKLVTIVVRDADDVNKTWARTASSFHESTGT